MVALKIIDVLVTLMIVIDTEQGVRVSARLIDLAHTREISLQKSI